MRRAEGGAGRRSRTGQAEEAWWQEGRVSKVDIAARGSLSSQVEGSCWLEDLYEGFSLQGGCRVDTPLGADQIRDAR